MAKSGFDFSGGLLAAGLAVACAGGAFFGLAHMATPADFGERMGRVEQRITAAEAVLNEPARHSALAAAAVCSETPEDAAGALKIRVQAAAAANGVTLTTFSAQSGPPGQDGVALSTVALQFEATGHYDAILAMLGVLAKQTPSIFVDTTDLNSQVSGVDFKFSGRVLCSARL